MSRLIPASKVTETTNTLNATIHGRPVRIWPASDPRRGKVWKYSFLFLDHMGGKIQGIIMAPDRQRVANSFTEQNIVEITRFSVTAATKDYQVVDYKYLLSITHQTQIKTLPSDMYPIPVYHFDFKRLEDVGTEITYEKAVLDTIARLSGFSTVRTVQSAGNARVQTMYLTNERGFTMDVALWADFIDQFDIAALYEQSKTTPIIIACNGLQVRKANPDIYSLKTYTGTRFYLDNTIKEISDYLHQTPYDGKTIVLEATPEMFNRTAPGRSLVARSPPVNITLAQLNGLYLDNFTETLYQCPSRIIQFTSPFDWCYAACTDCHKKLDRSSLGYYCSECHTRKRTFVPWYRMTVRVADQTDAAQFMLLGKTGEMIVGSDAVTMKMQQDQNDGAVPQPLQDIVNKAYLFTVQGKQLGPVLTYRTYTVSRHEPVPDDMLHLLPEPLLLIEDSPSADPSLIEAPVNTPPPSQDKGKAIAADLTPVTPLKRPVDPHSTESTVPTKTVRRRLQEDLTASTPPDITVPLNNPPKSLSAETIDESTHDD
ncbi:Replication factor-A carboxy-terminal domain protein [Rhynchospora pubera]|uniref:Replication factor-A carboxy-terminal domain protein n=1 Tax=Rhynchospora pubera TaxID=906938 RepID=A0AAV8FLS6_9POAL|nr:Replication factor-A carboxy-terminal domain protein [Rhynchospora pubera]